MDTLTSESETSPMSKFDPFHPSLISDNPDNFWNNDTKSSDLNNIIGNMDKKINSISPSYESVTTMTYIKNTFNYKIAIIILLIVLIVLIGTYYWFNTSSIFNPLEVTGTCKSNISTYCKDGNTVFNAQKISVNDLYNGDQSKCTHGKVFNERPLSCQPNNHNLLCEKIKETMQNQKIDEDDIRKIHKKCLNTEKPILPYLSEGMGKCLSGNYENIDDLNTCLVIGKNHNNIDYDIKEFFPKKINYNA